MMTYSDTVAYLFASQPAFHLVGAEAYKPGFANTNRLMEALGNPHTMFQSVHVTGTNGKGSTCHLIAACLQAAGMKVGLYTSPHLVDLRERIRVNGQMIPQTDVVRFVDQYRSVLDEVKPSFFETMMAMAFHYFADSEVDIAVIEVGLGGRLDSTNIITPLVSVITNIGFDHMEFLGNTLPAIAAEKAGIIKTHVPCVIGETHPLTTDVFIQRARECDILGDGLETTHCRLWFADQCGYLNRRRLRMVPKCELHGLYQAKNMQTAYVALQVLRQIYHLPLTDAVVAEGFANVCTMTGLVGRWQTIHEHPLTICDTGHNSHGLRYVAEQLLELSRDHTLHIVFGMVSDKDVMEVMRLMPHDAHYYFTQADTHRAIPANTLLALWQQTLSLSSVRSVTDSCYPTVAAALAAAQKAAAMDDVLFIGGSTYVVGEALRILQTALHS